MSEGGSEVREMGPRRSALPWPACTLAATQVLWLCVAAPVSAQMHVLDPSQSRFPHSSLVDFSKILDAPAGKHGFVRVGGDGHFYFEKGGRARFFGVNIASRSVFVDDAVIDQVVDVLAQAGINLVRLHHVDDVHGLIDGSRGDSRHLRPGRLRTLDYWIAACKAKGLYTYLDLLDYRTFKAGDDVPNASRLGRGAKPYACFDSRLIELQKEYATKLLHTHVNEFTGQSYAQDPAVALVEICDENGLLIKRKTWRTLASPYREQLKQKWNEFLRTRHGDTATLSAHWTNYLGKRALMPHESLERGTVELPQMDLGELNDSAYAASVGSPVRKNEGALFAYQVQRGYFREMKQHLRSLGVQVPLTAVVSSHQMPDLKSVADELDFLGTNFYWDHPYWSAGKDWKLPSYYDGENPLAEDSEAGFAPGVTRSRIAGKPLVVREWGYCWPNRFRAAGMVEATAYAMLQDIDALILFTYGTEAGSDKIGYFDVHMDPARWSLAGACATAFLRGDVAPARNSASLCYSHVDTFYYFRYLSPIHRLAWTTRVENRLYDDELHADGGLHLASGRSAAGEIRGSDRILYANGRSVDLADSARAAVAPAAAEFGVPTKRSGSQKVQFSGLLYSDGASRTLQLWPPFDLNALRAHGLTPIGTNDRSGAAYGFFDASTRTFAFNSLSAENVLRLGLDALAKLFGAPVSHASADSGTYRSDTGEIRRTSGNGQLTVDAPRFQAWAGALTPGRCDFGAVSIAGVSGPGAVVIMSLTEQPLAASSEFAIRVATDASNEGQRVVRPGSGSRRRGTVSSFGRAPVRTRGRQSERPWTFTVRGHGEICVHQSGGTLEIVHLADRWYLWTDTPGVALDLPGLAAGASAYAHNVDGKRHPLVVTDGVLRYPVDTLAVEVAFVRAPP